LILFYFRHVLSFVINCWNLQNKPLIGLQGTEQTDQTLKSLIRYSSISENKDQTYKGKDGQTETTANCNRREHSNQLPHFQHKIISFKSLVPIREGHTKHPLVSKMTGNPEADVQYERTGPGCC